jgi:hypothetical protein
LRLLVLVIFLRFFLCRSFFVLLEKTYEHFNGSYHGLRAVPQAEDLAWRLAGIKSIAMPPILFLVILILPPSNADMEFFMAMYVL